MEYTIPMIFVLFFFYSVLGWIVECTYVYLCNKKVMDRGFLIGPYCPIYGFGCVSFILLLNKYIDDPLALFILAAVICSCLEYMTSYIMERIFKARWWDYSKRMFNLNGRICLRLTVGFGIGALAVMYLIQPLIKPFLQSLPDGIALIIAIITSVIMLVDTIISFRIISSFKNVAKSVKKDSTAEITKKVKESLQSRGGLYKRLVSVFDFEASDSLLGSIRARVRNEKEKAKKRCSSEKKKNQLLEKKARLKNQIKEIDEEIKNK